jgi:hypothetical protein
MGFLYKIAAVSADGLDDGYDDDGDDDDGDDDDALCMYITHAACVKQTTPSHRDKCPSLHFVSLDNYNINPYPANVENMVIP